MRWSAGQVLHLAVELGEQGESAGLERLVGRVAAGGPLAHPGVGVAQPLVAPLLVAGHVEQHLADLVRDQPEEVLDGRRLDGLQGAHQPDPALVDDALQVVAVAQGGEVAVEHRRGDAAQPMVARSSSSARAVSSPRARRSIRPRRSSVVSPVITSATPTSRGSPRSPDRPAARTRWTRAHAGRPGRVAQAARAPSIVIDSSARRKPTRPGRLAHTHSPHDVRPIRRFPDPQSGHSRPLPARRALRFRRPACFRISTQVYRNHQSQSRLTGFGRRGGLILREGAGRGRRRRKAPSPLRVPCRSPSPIGRVSKSSRVRKRTGKQEHPWHAVLWSSKDAIACNRPILLIRSLRPAMRTAVGVGLSAQTTAEARLTDRTGQGPARGNALKSPRGDVAHVGMRRPGVIGVVGMRPVG